MTKITSLMDYNYKIHLWSIITHLFNIPPIIFFGKIVHPLLTESIIWLGYYSQTSYFEYKK